MPKVALFAYSAEPVGFTHVLLNAMEMKEKGYDVKVVIEGEATKLVSLLRNDTKPGASEWKRAKQAGVIDCVCQACVAKNGVLTAVIEQGLKVCGEMAGHPSVARYMEQGYVVMTF